jgi:transposase
VCAEIQERLRSFEEVIERLDQIPGVGRRTAEALLAEIGHDMDRFPTAAHLASWASMGPGKNESAGKRKSGRTRKANPWLRSLLVEAAQAAARTKHTHLSAQYHRLVNRRGKKKAIVAAVHTILIIVYHLLKDNSNDQDLGPRYFDELDRSRIQHLVRRPEGLGYEVSLQPVAR